MFKLQEIFPVSSKKTHKIIVVLLALVAFSLPFKDKFLVNLFTVLVMVIWFFSNPIKKLFTKDHNKAPLIAIVLFYILHAFALLYTENLQEGFFNLEIKISLFIFPLIFYTSSFSVKQTGFFIASFVIGSVLCCMICLGHAAYLTLITRKNSFFYQDLSWFQHPSYLSMYLTFCSVALFQLKLFDKPARIFIILFFR